MLSASNSDMMQVYPNPIIKGKVISLEIEDRYMSEQVSIYITDVIGNIVYHERIDSRDISETVFIDTDSFSVGIYFVRISDSRKELTKKLIIQ